MNILMILSKEFSTDPRVYKEARALKNNGNRVTVIMWDRHNGYSEHEEIEGIEVIRIRNNKLMKLLPNDLFRNPFWWRAAYRKGLELYRKKQFEFDVVHCHDLDTLQAGVWLKKKLKVKLIYDAHEIFGYMISRGMPNFVVNISFKFERTLIRNVDQIITVNEPLKIFFSKMISRPIEIIMNCGELITNKYVPPSNNIFTLGYFGVLDRSRKFPEIIDIIGEIKKVKFVIAGKKENLYQEVKRKCEKYGNIVFLGSIPYSEAIRRTFECDAIICLMDPKDKNSQVGLPNKVFEGMLAGRPILVSKNLYYSKLVEKEKCGLTVEYDDNEAIKDLIIRLRDNSSLCRRLGENGLKAALREYNWKRQEKKLIKVYEELMRRE